MTKKNQTTKLLSPEKSTKKLAFISKYQPNTLSQLQTDLAALEDDLQYAAELKKEKEKFHLTYQIETGVQQLIDIAGEINNLSSDIEALMLHFKEIAVDINHKYHLIQRSQHLLTNQVYRQSPLNIWEIHASTLPTVVQHGAKFILTAKIVDLFQPKQTLKN